MVNIVVWDFQIGRWVVFPRNITSIRPDLRSDGLQTSEGQIRDFLAPPETF